MCIKHGVPQGIILGPMFFWFILTNCQTVERINVHNLLITEKLEALRVFTDMV